MNIYLIKRTDANRDAGLWCNVYSLVVQCEDLKDTEFFIDAFFVSLERRGCSVDEKDPRFGDYSNLVDSSNYDDVTVEVTHIGITVEDNPQPKVICVNDYGS